MNEELHNRESEFHDAWALSTKLETINVLGMWESPTAMENQFILSAMGDLCGKTILDIGSGFGESSVYFALKGAKVTTVDISAAMVDIAVRLGRYYGVEIEGIVSVGETLDVPENQFDFVYIANAIHHVPDRAALFRQIHKALRPGGRFYSIDPLGYNPAINVYRRMATEVRTVDEEPLQLKDLSMVRSMFREVGHKEFWLATLLLFVKYYYIDKIHPNSERYWKRLLKESPSGLWWWMPLRRLDSILCRIPLLRLWCWNIVIWGEK